MRKKYGKDLHLTVESVMLGHASQTSHVMQNVHDKPGNLPDPDIFAVDMAKAQKEKILANAHTGAAAAISAAANGIARKNCFTVNL